MLGKMEVCSKDLGITDFDIPSSSNRKKKFLRKLSSRPETGQVLLSSIALLRHVVALSSPLLSSRVVYSRTRNNIDETGMGGGRRGRGSDDSIRGRGSACIKNNNVTRHRRSWPGLMGLNQPLFFSTAPPVPIVLHRTRPRAINSRLLLGRAWVPPNNKDNEPIGE